LKRTKDNQANTRISAALSHYINAQQCITASMVKVQTQCWQNCRPTFRLGPIGVDLAGLLRGRMASAEGGSVSSGVAYGEGCLLSSRLRGLGSVRELPQRGPGQSPGRKRILAYSEGHRTLIFVHYDKIWGGGQFVLASPVPNSCPPVPP